MADELAGELDLTPEIVRAPEGQAAEAERPVGAFDGGRRGLSPDLDIVAETRAGAGDFFGERRDAAAHGVEFVRDEENRPGGRGG